MSRLAVAVAVLSLAGAAVSEYLTWVHFAELQPFCVGGGGGCARVQSSPMRSSAACQWRSSGWPATWPCSPRWRCRNGR